MAAGERLRPRDTATLLVEAQIPHDRAALPDDALGQESGEIVIGNLDSEALDGGIDARALRHGPRAQQTLHLESKVKVNGARDVLLDDETACGDAADGELLVALGAHGGDLEVGDASGGGTAGEELAQSAERRRIALGVESDGSIGFVANPAVQAQSAGLLDHGSPEADALDTPVHARAKAVSSVRRRVPRSVRRRVPRARHQRASIAPCWTRRRCGLTKRAFAGNVHIPPQAVSSGRSALEKRGS